MRCLHCDKAERFESVANVQGALEVLRVVRHSWIGGCNVHHQRERAAGLDVSVHELGQNIEADLIVRHGLDDADRQRKDGRDEHGKHECPPRHVCRVRHDAKQAERKELHLVCKSLDIRFNTFLQVKHENLRRGTGPCTRTWALPCTWSSVSYEHLASRVCCFSTVPKSSCDDLGMCIQ